MVVGLVSIGACAKGADDFPDLAPGGDLREGGPPATDRDGGGDPVDGAITDAATDAADAATDACGAALAKITFDFETGLQGWTHGISDGIVSGVAGAPSWPYDGWLQGTATNPTPCKSLKCLGNELTQNYLQCTRGFVMSPPIDLTACKGRTVTLVFQHAYAFWTGSVAGTVYSDGGVVEVSPDGTSWAVPQGSYPGTLKINPDRGPSYACYSPSTFGVNNKQGFVGKQATTVKAELTLPATAITDKMRVRFSTGAGVSTATTDQNTSRSNTDFGWRIDDVGFVAK